MLDLSILKEKTFELKLKNGNILQIKKPNKLLLNNLYGFAMKIDYLTDIGEIQKETDAIILSILNNNKENITLEVEELEVLGIDLSIETLIFKHYFEFVKEVMSNPN